MQKGVTFYDFTAEDKAERLIDEIVKLREAIALAFMLPAHLLGGGDGSVH